MDRSSFNCNDNLGRFASSSPATASSNSPGRTYDVVASDSGEFGTTSFVHGMHSFHSASELQYYLNRIAGPGSRANITNAMHFRIVRSSVNANSNVRGVLTTQLPQGALTFGNRSNPAPGPNPLPLLPRSVSPSEDPFGSGTHGLVANLPQSGPINMPSGGNGTRTIALFCELHADSHPQSRESGQLGVNHAGNPHSANPQFPGRGIHLGYCQICQAWMLGSGNRSVTFPSSSI